jgi:hypothetical protein
MLLLASHLLLPRYFGRGVARGDAGGWLASRPPRTWLVIAISDRSAT